MRRKLVQPVLPNLFFRDGHLAIPGYVFETATEWADTGSQTILSVGVDLRDGQSVLAKIAPASGSGAICLEREAHILDQLSSNPEATSIVLRVVELMTLPRESGDCVVLLMAHPGPNELGRYFPPSKVNELLLAKTPETHPSPSREGQEYSTPSDNDNEMGSQQGDLSYYSVMDLASFLEFAVQSTHCLELVHKQGIIHREVRANAFHLNGHSGLLGGPSALVIAADTLEELSKRKVKEALCYLAPEQTGSVETSHEDHRTDLYSLGILFWTLLVGQGQMPFEGSPTEILHAIAQRRPMPVHEFRRDIPQVVAQIIERLLSKNPDARYNSAYGLKIDLLDCQRRLLAAVSSSVSDQSAELIPAFEIGMHDKFIGFTIPNTLFGREKELEIIRGVIRQVSSSHARQFGSHRPSFTTSQSNNGSHGEVSIQMEAGDDRSESTLSSISDSPSSAVASLGVGSIAISESTARAVTTKHGQGRDGSPASMSSLGLERRRSRHASKTRTARSGTRSVIVSGPAGVGKSSLILANQTKWRAHGLWGHAKFQTQATAPFTAILQCLSSVLRQLMIFQTDMQRFVMTLRTRLGPLLNNAPLLYQGAPEFKDMLRKHGVDINTPDLELLSTAELRVRFQTLVEQVFAVLADVRLLALFLDDLHEADEPSLDLIQALANSKGRMLILGSIRTEEGSSSKLDRLRHVFGSKSRVTWITLEPMNAASVLSLVSRTLRRPKEDCVHLSRVVYRISQGNAFAVRNFLASLHRHHKIVFDWQYNHWTFDLKKIEADLVSEESSALTDQHAYLESHWHELPSDAQRYLIWASHFGATFKADEVASVIDWEDSSSGSSDGENETDEAWRSQPVPSMKELTGRSATRSSIKGLQSAIAEGWLVQRARDMCSFAHDRHRQTAIAMAEKLPKDTIANMSLRIILMLRQDDRVIDPYRIAEHAKRCLKFIKEHSIREEVLGQLYEAGLAAWARGAHELALETLKNAQFLLTEEDRGNSYSRTFALYLKLAELYQWKGDVEASNCCLEDARPMSPEDIARCLKLRSNNAFLLNDFAGGLERTMEALEILGLKINLKATKEEMDLLFEEVKDAILAIGFQKLIELPRADNPRLDLTVQLLTVATLNAYWRLGDNFSEVILLSLTIIKVALSSGMSPGVSIGFFWILGVTAEERGLYDFSKALGRAGLQIAETHGSNSDKCRALVLYCASVSGYEDVHVRENIPRCELALKYGLSSGDRVFAEFALIHGILNRFFCCEHLAELLAEAEDAINDMSSWTPTSDRLTLANGILILIRALGGYTLYTSSANPTAESIFDTDKFNESAFLQHILQTSNNTPMVLSWYNSFKVVGLFCLGYYSEAAELGFSVLHSAKHHPNHRHIRFSLCYHSLAIIHCIRNGVVSIAQREIYLRQVGLNQEYIRKWLEPSPVNNSTWLALVDAELASLKGDNNALRLFDIAVTLATNNDWLFEEGWALFLQGSHLIRSGVEGLGVELQSRGISKQSQWGARGVVKYLISITGPSDRKIRRTNVFSSDVGVQTENVMLSLRQMPYSDDLPDDGYRGEEANRLTSSDLAAILRWSSDIASDINLSSALRRLTEIAAENSGAQCACVVMARERDYTVATTMLPPTPCVVHENPRHVKTLSDPLQRTVIEHCLNARTRIVVDDMTLDSRFASEAQYSLYRAVICLPIQSNRGQTIGALFLASRYSFLQSTVDVLTLFLQQASTSISNALLFRSVQAGTRENLKMISSQRAALEEARRSREQALKAAKIKSNFLASMSHELRTPFSSFYGLLDILAGTELDSAQQEIVMTAKTSCELLLKIIDSILDYSKLEASALKLELSGFPVENIIADCMELLLPMATRKLDLSFDIRPDVPPWIEADYARIRQVLMNLIGNAVKFTPSGFVCVVCSADRSMKPEVEDGRVPLRFTIQDTGIGLSKSDKEQLFTPFQQADTSSTRRFGGTGLGLSISRQLVQLMKGDIGVEESEVGVGSLFYFSIPVRIYESEESRKDAAGMENLKQLLLKPRPPRIIIVSPSETTLSLLSTLLNGFFVTSLKSTEDVLGLLRNTESKRTAIEFILVDEQSEARVNDLAQSVQDVRGSSERLKIIHLFTPTSETLSRQPAAGSLHTSVVRLTKPPRKLRLLQTLAQLRGIATDLLGGDAPDVLKDPGDVAMRSLFGRVLIAEDNNVARKLLRQQLERLELIVTETENGDEAVKASEWEAHEPGYFSVALFDHHMPICDGIDACKRIRLLEGKHKVTTILPIVALTADCQESTKQLCLSAGMNAFFAKPLKKTGVAAFAAVVYAAAVSAKANEPFLDQGFQFDFTSTGVPVPIPTTAQCDEIPLSWSRAAFTTGPNPQAPYIIQVYTSTFLFPSVIGVGSELQFDWPVPYVPGTQYQICMFDSNGVSGGCQRTMTVVPAENATVENQPACTNLTYPAGILDVDAKDHTGTLGQFAWVDQCTDISVQPKNGSAPFILTIAPTLHPPWNITSNDMSPINWTVQLSWGSSFFISLVDSDGQTWAYGPLHSGGQGPTNCLSLDATETDTDVSESVAIGSGIGGLLAGLAIGGFAAWFFFRRRHGSYYEPYISNRIHSSGKDGARIEMDTLYSPATHIAYPTDNTFSSQNSERNLTGRGHRLAPGSAYEIEPFALPDNSTEGLIPRSPGGGSTMAQPAASPASPVRPTSSHDEVLGTVSSTLANGSVSQARAPSAGGQVYVVHHDGGRAPVTVYASEGAEIIELPPRYNPDDRLLEEQRRTGSTPRKATRSPDMNLADR
ncbi:CHK1 [Sanghuangporus vaninii]